MEMKELNEELIALSLDLEKNKKTAVKKSNRGGYQSDFLENSHSIIKETKAIIAKAITQFAETIMLKNHIQLSLMIHGLMLIERIILIRLILMLGVI